MIKIIRTVVLTLSLLSPLAALAGQTRYQLRVDGLACPFCAYGIEKKLTRTDGVRSLDIDLDGGTVTVTMAEGATMTEAEASRIVEDAGFTLAGFEEMRTIDKQD